MSCRVVPYGLILTLRSATQEVTKRLAHDAKGKDDDDHKNMVDVILEEVGGVIEKHKSRSAEWYNEVSSDTSTLHILVVKPVS